MRTTPTPRLSPRARGRAAPTAGAAALVAAAALLNTTCASILGYEGDYYVDGGGKCPTGSGPSMVLIHTTDGHAYCIDSNEVTVGEYRAFFASPTLPAERPPECDMSSLSPRAGSTYSPMSAGTDMLPITEVGWCAALAYCSWAKKRLCGLIGGGIEPINIGVDEKSEWYFACAGPDGGAAPDPLTCNLAPGPVVDVRYNDACHGQSPPYDGVRNMLGNASEWVNNRDNSMPPKVQNRGNSYLQASSMCSVLSAVQFITDTSPQGSPGIRCCADAIP